MESIARETLAVSLEEEMRRSYLDYAMSVIVGRALPDARDGLKPVHRRVLYAMYELGNDWNKPYKKSARIVGDVIGKYHPHGDSAVYDTIVRMAQDFSLRYPLIDGQGNFGSIDGDAAAAMRYTEIRMARIGHELLADIDKETVDFGPNYDNSEREPLVLPTRVPNLLINGASGIAVGMATNIPPHNLSEVVDGCLALLENPELTVDDLMRYIPAPDFPTAGLIVGLEGVREGYRTGRGRVVMRARTHFETIGKGASERPAIIIDELPYQVNKRTLLERIAELVNEKRIDGISEIRDESDKSGMRVVIELRRGEHPEVVLNHLFKLTQLQDTFGMNLVALVDGRPRTLNLKELVECFLDHRREVVTRRTVFELRKARERAHILEGLAVALANVDEIIALIKASPTPAAAKTALLSRRWRSPLVEEMLSRAVADARAYRPEGLPAEFGLAQQGYRLSEAQADAILALRLQRLTGLEQEKILNEYREVIDRITDLLDILARRERVTAIIADELRDVKARFGDPRRSEIVTEADEIRLEDLIAPHETVVTLTHSGYVKRQPLDDYRAQRRGGRGKLAASTKEDDFAEQLFVANSHDWVLCFSSRGRVYWLRVFDLPEGGRTGRGKPIVNLLPIQPGEQIQAVLSVKTFASDAFVFFATAQGVVKKTALDAFANPRKAGIIALGLDDGDRLIGVAITDGDADVMLLSDAGKAVRFSEHDVRPMGREARGVRGMQLEEGQRVVAMVAVAQPDEDASLLLATENGFGKRTAVAEFTRHSRGTKGMIAIQTSARNGKLVGACLVRPGDEVMLMSQNGVVIRTRVDDIRELGRATQGVTLMALDANDRLAAVVKVAQGPNGETDECDG
ncbi:MAG TPA: DNA gyrase subunit A [Hydrogenophilus thermoluteolus]|nr:DNA gyrase subunit A [Hydrogenophilus thermoluteolus]HNU19454.1 DNA gyrase subunit A [Hydrogenophilus thermoluteolus]